MMIIEKNNLTDKFEPTKLKYLIGRYNWYSRDCFSSPTASKDRKLKRTVYFKDFTPRFLAEDNGPLSTRSNILKSEIHCYSMINLSYYSA